MTEEAAWVHFRFEWPMKNGQVCLCPIKHNHLGQWEDEEELAD